MSILIAYLIIGLVMTVGVLLEVSYDPFETIVFVGVFPLFWLPQIVAFLYANDFDMDALAPPRWHFDMARRQQSDHELYGC